MQTYIPSGDWMECAKALGRNELIASLKGSVSVLQVLHEHGNPESLEQFARLPLVDLWREHDAILAVYGITLMEELVARGPVKVMRGGAGASHAQLGIEPIKKALHEHLSWAMSGSYKMEKPTWASDEDFLLSQRALLIRTNPLFYGPRWPSVDARLPELWPNVV